MSARFLRLVVCVFLFSAVMPATPAVGAFAPYAFKTKLMGAGGSAGAAEGYAVAIDGDTLVTGAPNDTNASGIGVGAAYVYVRSGGAWTFRQKLIPPAGPTPQRFGDAVAIEGDTVLVGDPDADTEAGNGAGVVAVFVRSGTAWSLQATLAPPAAAASDAFGFSVAVEDDRAAVGAAAADAHATDGGAAYVFERTGSTWSAGGLLPATAVDAGDLYGYSVAVSGDTVAAGSPDDGAPGFVHTGSVRVFVKSGTWSEQARILSNVLETDACMGRSVALSGGTVLAGADTASTPGVHSGAAYVFTRSGTVWTQQQKLVPADSAANARFGRGAALEGDSAVIGSWAATAGAVPEAGAAYVFTRAGTVWTERQRLTPSDAEADDRFGYSVALSGDTVVSGAESDSNASGGQAGSAYVFESISATSITIKTTATSVYVGAVPILSGAVTPHEMIGKNIVVYVKKPGKTYWSYSSNRTVYNLNGNPAWQYKYYFKAGMVKGYYVFKANVPAWPGFVGSWSPTTVTIRLR